MLCRAEMFSSGGDALIVGVVFVVVLPLLFAAFLCSFVFIYLYRHQMRAASFVLVEDPDEVSPFITSPMAARQCDPCCPVPAVALPDSKAQLPAGLFAGKETWQLTSHISHLIAYSTHLS